MSAFGSVFKLKFPSHECISSRAQRSLHLGDSFHTRWNILSLSYSVRPLCHYSSLASSNWLKHYMGPCCVFWQQLNHLEQHSLGRTVKNPDLSCTMGWPPGLRTELNVLWGIERRSPWWDEAGVNSCREWSPVSDLYRLRNKAIRKSECWWFFFCLFFFFWCKEI